MKHFFRDILYYTYLPATVRAKEIDTKNKKCN